MRVFKQYALVVVLIGFSGVFVSEVNGQVPAPPSKNVNAEPPSQNAKSASAPNPSYIVGPQDVLSVTVFDEAQLSGRFRVDNDGQFNYPFVGRLQAGGATVAEIAARIRTKLADGYLRDPQVTVEVEVYRSQNVFVMGEVRSPGKYTVTGGVTIVEALAQAGSVTPTAGNQVLVLHPKKATDNDAGSGEPSNPDVQRVNLADIQSGDLSANITVHDGDTIFVPKAQRFFVTGYVHNPGTYVLEPDLTVLQAISMAGGVTDLGSSRGLRVVRNKKEMDAKPTDIVQADDMIIVRRRRM